MRPLNKGLLASLLVWAMCLPAVFGQNGPVRLLGATPWFWNGSTLRATVSAHAKGYRTLTNFNVDWSRHKVTAWYYSPSLKAWKTKVIPMKNSYGDYGFFSTDIDLDVGPVVPKIYLQYDTPNGTYYDNNNGAMYYVNPSTDGAWMSATKGAVGGKVGLWYAKLTNTQGFKVEWNDVNVEMYVQNQGKTNLEAGIVYSLDNWNSRVTLPAVNKGPAAQWASDVSIFQVEKTFTGRPLVFTGIQFFTYYIDKDTGVLQVDNNFGMNYELSKTKYAEIL